MTRRRTPDRWGRTAATIATAALLRLAVGLMLGIEL
jgi:hypothetical protein